MLAGGGAELAEHPAAALWRCGPPADLSLAGQHHRGLAVSPVSALRWTFLLCFLAVVCLPRGCLLVGAMCHTMCCCAASQNNVQRCRKAAASAARPSVTWLNSASTRLWACRLSCSSRATPGSPRRPCYSAIHAAATEQGAWGCMRPENVTKTLHSNIFLCEGSNLLTFLY